VAPADPQLQLQKRAQQWRGAGLTYTAIAARLGITPAQARALVVRKRPLQTVR